MYSLKQDLLAFQPSFQTLGKVGLSRGIDSPHKLQTHLGNKQEGL